MIDEENAAPGDETAVLDDQLTDETPEAEAEAPPETQETAEATDETGEKRVPWFQKRINELTAARRAEESAKNQLRTENEALKAMLAPAPKVEGAPPAADTPKTAPVPPQDFDKAVEERAAAMLRQQDFNRQSANVYQKGLTAFPGKFDGALQNLQAAGVYSDQDMSFVEAAMATEAPEHLLYALGNNPEEAMRLAALPQTQRAIALDRMARDLKTPPVSTSNAPPPVTPISGARTSRPFDASDTKTPTELWMKERNKQVAALKAAR